MRWILLLMLTSCGGYMTTFHRDEVGNVTHVTKISEKDYYKQKGISR